MIKLITNELTKIRKEHAYTKLSDIIFSENDSVLHGTFRYKSWMLKDKVIKWGLPYSRSNIGLYDNDDFRFKNNNLKKKL